MVVGKIGSTLAMLLSEFGIQHESNHHLVKCRGIYQEAAYFSADICRVVCWKRGWSTDLHYFRSTYVL